MAMTRLMSLLMILFCAWISLSEDGIHVASSETVPELTEDDIPGAKLEEPLESHAVHALRRWLLCHQWRIQGGAQGAQAPPP